MKRQKDRVSTKAIDLHNRVSPDWYWRGVKENIFQRFWHGRRLAEVGKIVESTGKGTALDVGCADGYFTSFILEKSGAEKITGVDIRKSCIEFARKKFKADKRFIFIEGDIYCLPFPDKSFDMVFCLEILEHLERLKGALCQIRRLIKPGGYLIVLVPTENWLFNFVWSFWMRSKGKVWSGTHIQSFSSDPSYLFRELGFKVEVNRRFLFRMLQLLKLRLEK